MEFRLNKIDTDLRQKVNDATKSGIIHSKRSLQVNKDKKERNFKETYYKLQKYNKNKKLVVDAEKIDNIEIDGFKENIEDDDNTQGIFLDVKR